MWRIRHLRRFIERYEVPSASHAHGLATLVRHSVVWLVLHLLGSGNLKGICCVLLSDCRSLTDHCAKSSTSLTEKRVGLEMADVRETAGDSLLWIPNEVMLADGLTKHLPKESVSHNICLTNKFRICYSSGDSKKQQTRQSFAG